MQIGQSPGTFTIDGGYRQGANGVLEIEIAGSVPGIGYDVLSVTGDAILDGRGLPGARPAAAVAARGRLMSMLDGSYADSS